MSIRTIVLATSCLAAIPAAQAQEQPGVPVPARPGTQPLPGAPVTPGNPVIMPRPTLERPQTPLEPAPLKAPEPVRPVPCLPNAGPGPASVSASPAVIRDGVPVTLTVTFQCAWPATLTSAYLVSFTGSSPSTDRAAGETMVAFLNQIPRTQVMGGASSVSARFTPRGLVAPVVFQLKAEVATPRRIGTPAVTVNLAGGGQALPPPPPPPNPGCRPVLTMNARETAVTAGALVHVDLTLSCTPSTPVQVQILSTRSDLVAPPPGGLVTIPAGRAALTAELTSSRTAFGTTTIRALLSNPAGNTTPGDDVIVVR